MKIPCINKPKLGDTNEQNLIQISLYEISVNNNKDNNNDDDDMNVMGEINRQI